MENYTKGKNVEEILERNRLPFKNLPQNFLWMQVKPLACTYVSVYFIS